MDPIDDKPIDSMCWHDWPTSPDCSLHFCNLSNEPLVAISSFVLFPMDLTMTRKHKETEAEHYKQSNSWPSM